MFYSVGDTATSDVMQYAEGVGIMLEIQNVRIHFGSEICACSLLTPKTSVPLSFLYRKKKKKKS